MSEADKVYEEVIGGCRKEVKSNLSTIEKIKLFFKDETIKLEMEEKADELAKERVRNRIVNMSLGHMAREASRQRRIDKACGLRRF